MLDKRLGSIFGLAVGDAVGTTVEFSPRGSFPPVTDMVGGGPFQLAPGEWTDDMSMAMCLLASLVQCNTFDPVDQMDKYVAWFKHGYMGSNDSCFDIGNTTRNALQRWISYRQDPFCGDQGKNSAGNGSIMRLAPVPMFFHNNPELAIKYSAESSKTTHGEPSCIDACRYMAGILVGAMLGGSKCELLRARYHPTKGQWSNEELHPNIQAIADGSFKDKTRDEIQSSGWVVHTLEAALWSFNNTKTYKDGLLQAVNLGGDADTIGAVYGQIAGAYYGMSGIPDEWVSKLAKVDVITKLSHTLCYNSSL